MGFQRHQQRFVAMYHRSQCQSELKLGHGLVMLWARWDILDNGLCGPSAEKHVSVRLIMVAGAKKTPHRQEMRQSLPRMLRAVQHHVDFDANPAQLAR
jgi:hypothetical protein